MMKRRLLRNDRRGATIVEFAFVLPVLMTLFFGTIELGHCLLARLTLDSAVVEAARIATASTGSTETERDRIMRASITSAMSLYPAAPGRTLTITSQVFNDFSSSYAETYTDANANGRYDLGESYVDRNRNGQWDAAAPKSGSMGGPGDVVTITASYPKGMLFGFLGFRPNRIFDLSATTVVRNEAVARSNR